MDQSGEYPGGTHITGCGEEAAADKVGKWWDGFDERQLRLIRNCERYASGDPAGLPGHQLMLIVAKMARLLLRMANELEEIDGSAG